jgi:hypothetical protein
MRCLLRLIACLIALMGPATAHPAAAATLQKPEMAPFRPLSVSTLHRKSFQSPAFPAHAPVLVFTPLDLLSNDPLRSACMRELGDRVRNGHRLDKSVLKYLREMAAVSRRLRRRDMVWYYEEAWEFSAVRIYGALPPRKQDLLGTFYQPDNPAVPAGFRPAASQCPLRRIVKLNDHPHGFTTLSWEMLECGHELMAPVGYSVPATKRRCIYCAYEALSKKKKPASSVAAIAKSKAVGA